MEFGRDDVVAGAADRAQAVAVGDGRGAAAVVDEAGGVESANCLRRGEAVQAEHLRQRLFGEGTVSCPIAWIRRV